MPLWRENAAPRRMGCCSTGLAKVESTRTGTALACLTTAAMSMTLSVGLPGVSMITRQVSSRRQAPTVAGVAQDTSSGSRPLSRRWSVVP